MTILYAMSYYFSFCTPLIMEPTVPGAKGPPHLKLICLLLEAKGPRRPRAKGLSPFIYYVLRKPKVRLAAITPPLHTSFVINQIS
jgi:hypothetical protein